MSEGVLVWTQWRDLPMPPGAVAAPTDGLYPSEVDIEKIEFFVPRYMGGADAIRDLSRFTSLKVLQSPNAGVDDLIKICPADVTLCNAAGVHDDSTAELALGLALASRRGFAHFAHQQHDSHWDHKRMKNLIDSEVAIVGNGRIGKRIREMLQPFGASVTTFSRSGKDGSKTMSEFDELLPTFDVVILIVPLTDETRHLMDARRIARMKHGASLVNVARGAVVDTDALVQALTDEKILAALDVTDPEPLPSDHPLWKAPGLILTPHVGGDSEAFLPRGRQLVLDQIARYVANEPLVNVIAH